MTRTKVLLVLAATFWLLMPQCAQAQQAPNGDFEAAVNLYYKAQWPQATEAFRKVLEKDPRDTMSMMYLITCYIKRNDLHSIEYEVEQKAVASEGKDALALAHLGLGYLARSMHEPQFLDEAEKEFQKALQIDKDNSIAHCGMGLVYYQRRMMPRAKGHFVEALRNNPNDLMAIERIGDITMVDEKRPQDALQMFDSLVAKSPAYPDGYWYVGSANFDSGNYDKTIANMQKCMELDPTGLTQGYHAPMLMGKAYMKLKQYSDASQAFQLALKMNPNNPEAKYYLDQVQNPPKN